MNSTTDKRDIRSLSKEEIMQFFVENGDKAFRAQQVYEWLWGKSAQSFDEMTNISLNVRHLLSRHFTINALKVKHLQISSDKTIKNAFSLYDGNIIEGVLIPTPKRMTACVSSQVGCSLTCKFCATGRLKRIRNLNADEIYDQVVIIRKQALEYYNTALTNIVYMGMGEPLLNYANVLQSIDHITADDGLNVSPKRITVSTAGIAKMIKQLGDDKVKFNLALSLHAANDEKRSKIMPINDSNSLSSLGEALQYFYSKTSSVVTFEYIIFKDFNDKLEDAKQLVQFCKKLPSKVNIIEYNTIDGGEFKKASEENTKIFREYLESRNIIAKVRRSRGKDIDAACGQLANMSSKE